MTEEQFDELARKLARPMSRRTAFKAVLGAAVAGVLARFGSRSAEAQVRAYQFNGTSVNSTNTLGNWWGNANQLKVACNQYCDDTFPHNSLAWQNCIRTANTDITHAVDPSWHGPLTSLCFSECGPFFTSTSSSGVAAWIGNVIFSSSVPHHSTDRYRTTYLCNNGPNSTNSFCCFADGYQFDVTTVTCDYTAKTCTAWTFQKD